MEYENNNWKKHFEATNFTGEPDAVANADVISLEAVINMLVKKNICSVEELFRLEGKIREQNKNLNKANFISTQSNHEQSGHSGLKRIMGKRRWTRRIGKTLFGWKWKKVKKSPHIS